MAVYENIFQPGTDGTFHACVGENGQHDFRTYSEGYLEAADKLLTDIIENGNLGGRDTLVHPILYSIRHSIELAIKYMSSYLSSEIKYEKLGSLTGHSLNDLYKKFSTARKLDRRLAKAIADLEEPVDALHSVDPDGQDFRYPVDSDNNQTLNGKRIVNLLAVKEMFVAVDSIVRSMFQLIEEIYTERHLGAYVNKLGDSAVNRPDLERLSKGLPGAEGSTQAEWDVAQKHWVKELEISNSIYRKAVAFIKQHRQFAANMGVHIPLNSLTEDALKKLLFSTRSPLSDIEVLKLYREQIQSQPNESVAEISALFCLGSGRQYSEEFEMEYQRELREFHSLEGDALEQARVKSFSHVVSKTNFCDGFKRGLNMVGYGHLLSETIT